MAPIESSPYRRDEPRHLTNLALAAAGGDSHTVRNRLCAANVGLVHHMVRRCGATLDTYEDAVGVGTEALLRACARWDPERGVSLAHYAEPWIRQAVVRSLRDGRRAHAQLCETPGPLEDLEVRSVALDDVLGDETVGSLSRRHALVQALASLDDDVRSTFALFIKHLGDEAAAAAAAGTAVGSWRRRCDRAWSMLRHPAGPCLGWDGSESDPTSGTGYHRWRIAPPPGSFVERAACRGLGVTRFFPTRGTTARAGIEVCVTCPVRTDCGSYATAYGSVVGIWGGTVERDRRSVRVGRVAAATRSTG